MRRWLPIALLVVLAGLAWLVLRGRGAHDGPVASQNAGSPAAPRAESPAAEISAESSVDARHAEFAPKAAESIVPAAAPDPNLAHIKVRVIGKMSRKPVANVRLNAQLKNPDKPISQLEAASINRGDLEHLPVTYRDGRASIDLPPAHEGTIWAHGEDGQSGQASLEFPALRAGESREFELEIPDGIDAHLFGMVVVGGTDEPVAGARVRLIPAGTSPREWHAPGAGELVTGNDGRFELRFSSWQDQQICVQAADYGMRYADPDAQHSDPSRPLLVRISRAGTLKGLVLDARGAPIEGAWIDLSVRGYALSSSIADPQGFVPGGLSFPPDENWRAQTGADGRATLEGLPPGVEFDLDLNESGRTLLRSLGALVLAPGEVAEREWRIGSTTAIHGRVLDQSSRPVVCEIWLAPADDQGTRPFQFYDAPRVLSKAVADAEGRFELREVPPGRWRVGLAGDLDEAHAPEADGLADGGVNLETAGEPSLELVLHVSRGLYIHGTVIDPAGTPVGNCNVFGQGPTQEYRNAHTAPDGMFSFGPLAGGSYSLSAMSIGPCASSDAVEAMAGTNGIVLQLKPGGRIHGRILDEAGAALPVCNLMFAPATAHPGQFGLGMSTEARNGVFEEQGLAPDRWSVAAQTSDGRFAMQSGIEVGPDKDAGEIVLRVRPGGKLRLVYRGAKPKVFVSMTANGAAVSFPAPLEKDKPAEYLAPAGALIVEIRETFDGEARTKTVELKPGETKEVVVTDQD